MTGSLQSKAYLNFRYDAERSQTWLSERKLGGLCHLSKPYWDGNVLVAQMINPTAGFFSGDDFVIQIDVEQGASVALTSPSATRFYDTEDIPVKLTQKFQVRENGYLEVMPDWSIPQAGSEVSQKTELILDKGASCVLLERFMPGRIAHGEAYTYKSFTATTSIQYAGELQVHERMQLKGENGPWPLAVNSWEVCYYSAFWIVLDDVDHIFSHVSHIEKLFSEDKIHCGVSQLSKQVIAIRIITDKSIKMKKSIERVRSHLSDVLPQLKSTDRLF